MNTCEFRVSMQRSLQTVMDGRFAPRRMCNNERVILQNSFRLFCWRALMVAFHHETFDLLFPKWFCSPKMAEAVSSEQSSIESWEEGKFDSEKVWQFDRK